MIFSFHPILNNVRQNIKVQGRLYHLLSICHNVKYIDALLKYKIFTLFHRME